MVTILFANIHGFSEIVPELPDQHPHLIDQLDQLFIHYDEIITQYPIAKIKTIGDSYMCAGGIPDKNITNPVEVVLAAFEMLQCTETFFARNGCKQNIHFAVHTGPVSAYTNGKVKVTYDIKGDTVNTVSRLESCGTPGKVFISVMTYELVKEFFDCEYYGKLPVKYTGLLDIYAVQGIKPELSIHGKGLKPSEDFRIKFSLIRFHDLQEHILDILEQHLR
jgi:class 3 adenylate cyclase